MSSARSQLRRGSLGWKDLVFFVVAAAAPLTVMAGVAPLAILFAGEVTPLGYLVAGLTLILFACGFTAMSRYVQNAGAFYAYVTRGLGRPAGSGAAFLAVIAYNLMELGLVAGTGYFAEQTIDNLFGVHVPWPVWSVATALVIGLLGYLRITLSAKVLGLALILEVLMLLVFEVGMVIRDGFDGYDVASFDATQLGGEGTGGLFIFAIAAFIGFEATAIYAEEVRDPQRSVPIATYTALAFLALFYSFTVWSVIAFYGGSEAQDVAASPDGPSMVYTATEAVAGAWASDAMQVLIVTSAFAATLAFHNVSTRYMFALGREGLLPRTLAKIDRRHASPVNAVIVQTALGLTVIAVGAATSSDPYLVVLLWANGPGVVGIMILQALTAVAVVGFFRGSLRGHSPLAVIVAPLAAAITLSALTFLVVKNIDLTTGADTATNVLLLLPLPLAFAFGTARALRIRRTDPTRYATLTTLEVEADPDSSQPSQEQDEIDA